MEKKERGNKQRKHSIIVQQQGHGLILISVTFLFHFFRLREK